MPLARHLFHALAAAALFAALALPASAEGRFELREVDGGFVRLDTETGQVSHCTAQGSGLACRAAADDIAALTEELAGAQTRIAALEAEVARLERLAGDKEDRPLTDELPSDEEMEELGGWFERMAKIFARVMGNVAKDLEENAPGSPGGSDGAAPGSGDGASAL